RALLELDAGVEILGVLTHDDQVDVVVARADARVALTRAYLAVEVERLPERDVDGAEPGSDGRRDRALDRHAVSADRLEDVVGQGVSAVLVHDVRPGVLNVPVDLGAARVENPPRRVRDLGAGA